MPKKLDVKNRWTNSKSLKREATYAFYYNKYFNLYMNAYEFKGIEKEQQDYILRKLWSVGSISAFIVEGTKLKEGEVPQNLNEYPNGMIAFVPFAPFSFDINDWAIKVNLVQVRGATFIPNRTMIVNKDVVIGYAQRNKKSIYSIVDFYINKIVDVEMTIGVQLTSHKVPWLLATTPENEERIKKLFERLDNDEEVLYVSADEIEAIKSLQSGNSYILDKLFQYKTALENELLTHLGFNNIGSMEKKEHFVVDEVNANNETIKNNSDNFLNSMKEFCERIKKYLGYDIDVEATSTPLVVNKNDKSKGDEENGNE